MMTLEAIARATGGTLEGTNTTVSAVLTDSRQLAPGCVFVCLRGEKFDAHSFIPQAAAAGAVALVVDTAYMGPLPLPAVRVKDTREALGAIARHWRRALDPTVIAITGSSGKTSTKETVAAYFKLGFDVLKTEANHNNEIGVPLTLLNLRPSQRVAVVEMGMRAEGEIAYLTEIAEPDVGIVTNIGTAHIGRLGSREAIARAKSELWRHMPAGGIAVAPYDDALAMQAARAWGGPLVTFSLEAPEATIFAHDVRREGEGQRFTVYWKPGDDFGHPDIRHGRAEITLPLWGDHHRANALAAIAAGWALGFTPAPHLVIAPEALPGRSVVHEVHGVALIDDAYNANPDSMRAALRAFAEFPSHGRRFAVIGDMGELGEEAPQAHEEVGRYLQDLSLDGVVAVGQLARHYQAGWADVHHFEDPTVACEQLATELRPGDRVLLKASRAARFENLLSCLQSQLEKLVP